MLVAFLDAPVKSLLCVPVIHGQSEEIFCMVCLFNEKSTGRLVSSACTKTENAEKKPAELNKRNDLHERT